MNITHVTSLTLGHGGAGCCCCISDMNRELGGTSFLDIVVVGVTGAFISWDLVTIIL